MTDHNEAVRKARENRMIAETQLNHLLKTVQPVEGKDNFNMLALQGWDMDDMEYVEEFNIPKEYAYTNNINMYMLDKIQTENEQFYMQPKTTDE